MSGVRRHVETMYGLLLEWLDCEGVYSSLLNMLNHASSFTSARLAGASENDRPCDSGVASVDVFVDYVFEGELWDDDMVWGELSEIWEVGGVDGARRLVKCYEELVRFKRALKNGIKVRIVEGVAGDDRGSRR